MARKARNPSDKSASGKEPDSARIQCHFISNTHWDREWRFTAQRTRYYLVEMLDRLLDIFEKEPDFKSFHLDSQTLPIQDYLEARPEKEDAIRKYITDGRLLVGPWFCLPDEFCVGGESLVRNLLLGHKIARRFGGVSKTGYSPFSWGQISQMPQIYKNFGIEMMSFYRGINTRVAPESECIWEGPDGSQIVVSRFGPRPRYNVWYVIQRPVYWNFKDVDNRYLSWKDVGGPFRFVDEKNALLDGKYLHPVYQYHSEHIAHAAAQALAEQDGHWTTPHRFWSAGHDTSFPDIREVQMIADLNAAVGDKADVFHSSVKAWQDGILANARKDWPVVRGEMRHAASPGSSSVLIGWVTSARTYLKQENFQTEAALMNYAEPLAVFAGMLGAAYPANFIEMATNWLLQNHGHDSIAGCSRDAIHDDMLFRYRQSREISSCVTERAVMDIAGSLNLSDWSADAMALFVYNPAPSKRTEVMPILLDMPEEWNCNGFTILDEQGKALAFDVIEKTSPVYPLYFNCNDVINPIRSSRYKVNVELPDVPGMGYRTFRVVPFNKDPKKTLLGKPKATLVTGPAQMENEFVRVRINSNGTLNVADKKTGREYQGLGYFRDSSEIGNPWVHETVPNEVVFTTLNEKANVMLVRNGQLEASFKVAMDWALPEGSSGDEKTRSRHLKPYRIVNTVTLRKGTPWVEIVSEVDNSVEDHYLQVCFPSGIKADKVAAQANFDVVERPLVDAERPLCYEEPPSEKPMNSFVDISDGEAGFALLNEGLKAYEAQNDSDRTLSLSLLRCFSLRIFAMTEATDYSRVDKGSQCPGKNRFRYAVMPHEGDWVKAGLWQAAERFNLPFAPAQMGITSHGREPLTKSFLELEPAILHVSAVKQSQDAQGWVVRLFNPLDCSVQGRIRLNGGKANPSETFSPVQRVQKEFALPEPNDKPWRKIRETTLEEIPVADLAMDSAGWVDFTIGKKKIMTLEFRP